MHIPPEGLCVPASACLLSQEAMNHEMLEMMRLAMHNRAHLAKLHAPGQLMQELLSLRRAVVCCKKLGNGFLSFGFFFGGMEEHKKFRRGKAGSSHIRLKERCESQPYGGEGISQDVCHPLPVFCCSRLSPGKPASLTEPLCDSGLSIPSLVPIITYARIGSYSSADL